MRLCKDWPSNEPNAMQFLGTFFFSGDETLQLLLAVFSCQITYGLICFLSNSINYEPVKKKISPTFYMSTRNDHVFDCLNEDLPESFFLLTSKK